MNRRIACLACVLLACVPLAAAQDVYQTWFDEFPLGPVHGHCGWTSTHPQEPHIDNVNPTWTPKHLRFEHVGPPPGGERITAHSPDIGPFPPHVDWGFAYADICISDTKGATFEFAIHTPQANTLNAAMRFMPGGDVFVLGDSPSGPEYFDAGFDWPVGAYFHADIELMYGGVNYTIWNVGHVWAPGAARLTAEQASFTCYGDGNYDRVYDVDCIGYGWIPEPSALLLLLVGLCSARPGRTR